MGLAWPLEEACFWDVGTVSVSQDTDSLAAIPKGEKRCNLAPGGAENPKARSHLVLADLAPTTFPSDPGAYGADPSLACGTLGLRGRGSAR